MTTTNKTQAPPITASMLYDLVACPHRVTMDLFAERKLKRLAGGIFRSC